MKKLLKLWVILGCMVTCIYLSQAVSVNAETNDTETVITYDDGTTKTKDGVLNPENLTEKQIDSIDTFSVEYNDETVLEVTAQDDADTTTDYFYVEFTVSEKDNTSCFLAGLTDNNVKTVEDTIITALNEGATTIDMESIDFIDTEKNNNGDSGLCWAASACNVLDYTGWIKQTDDFENTDDLFDEVVEKGTNDGALEMNLFSWFFNGVTANTEFPTFQKGTGRFVDGYLFTKLAKEYKNPTPESIAEVIDSMRKGYGSTIDIYFSDTELGHSITFWGCVFDNDYPVTSDKHYTDVFVTDSDNNFGNAENRAYSPNKMEMYALTPSSDGWTLNYGGDEDNNVSVTGLVTLEPYSENAPKETEPLASLDMTRNINIGVENIALSSVDAKVDNRSSVPEGQKLNMTVSLSNYGKQLDEDQTETIPYEYEIFDSEGNSQYQGKGTRTVDDGFTKEKYDVFDIAIPSLEPGTYTVKFEVNKDKSIKEAFYMDNDDSTTFEVVSSNYDISSMKINGTVSEYENGSGTVTFEYSQMDELLNSPNLTCKVYELDEDTKEETTWKLVYDSSKNESVVPDTLKAGAYKDIKYAFVFNNDDEKDIVVSTEVNPSYNKFGLEEADDAISEFTTVRKGATSLLGGEKIKCKVEDMSTKEREEDKELTLQVFAEYYYEDEAIDDDIVEIAAQVELYSGTVTMAAGEKEKEITIPDKWKNSLKEITDYNLKAVLFDNGNEIDSITLGKISVQEKGSTKVTTEVNNPIDGETSLKEAIAYAEEINSKASITFASDLDEIVLDSDKVVEYIAQVNGKITVDGMKGRTSPIRLTNPLATALFKVNKGASLTMSNVIVSSTWDEDDSDKDDLAIITGTDADIIVDNCNFESCMGFHGAGVHVKNGSLKMSNCSFRDLFAAAGSAVFTEGNAKADLLNCTILNCLTKSSGSAIYDYTNDEGYCNIVNCTILGNASAGLGSSVEGSKTCNIVNSIVVSSEYPNEDDETSVSVGGYANVYGSYIGTKTSSVTKDASCVSGKLSSVAYLYTSKGIQREAYNRKDSQQILPRLTKVASKGYTVKVQNGKLVLVNANGDKVQTNVDAAFSSYTKDIAGNSRGYYYGSYAKTYVPVKQKITVKTKSKTISYKKLKKKNQTFKISATAKTSLTYKKVKGNKKITISKAGKITVKKKLKKGTYTIYVKATAAKNCKYASATKTAKIKIKVK